MNVILMALVYWDSVKSETKFWMTQERLDAMKKDDWYVVSVRLDSMVFNGRSVRLRDVLK